MTSISTSEISKQIQAAISKASKLTGTDFNYLLKTAMRESSLRPNVKSQSSSASGLFQFIESTWLKTIKEDGAKYNLGEYAKHIKKDVKGHYSIPNLQMKEKILALRENPEVSALMAGAYAKKNTSYIQQKIGRQPNAGEVYAAHFLGPKDAVRLIRLNELQPAANADVFFAKAAESNKNIFYKNGKSLTISEVYRSLAASHKTNSVQNGSSEVIGAWSVQVLPARKNIEPLIAKADFKAGAVKSGSGSIGVWGNISGVESSSSEADSEALKKVKVPNLYSKK